MERHLLFFDIDGTLITEGDGRIPESAKTALKKARENGHLVFLNTGRSLSELDDKIKSLGYDGLVCGCGTYIEFQGKQLFIKELGNEVSREIAQDLEYFNIDGLLEGTHALYHRRESVLPLMDMLKKAYAPLTAGDIKYWDDPMINFDKMALWINDSSDFESFYNKYKDMFEFINRESDFYEIVPTGYSKATGIEFLLKYLDIPLERAVAVGDSANDISMLSYVKKSMAMGNSKAFLYDIVDFVTKDIEQDGIYYGLAHYGIID